MAKKNSYTEKKKSFMGYNAGKKILHRCTSGKKFYHQKFGKKFLHKPNHPYHASKVKWSAPK